MHPQALIVDASPTENDYFLRAIRVQARGMGLPVIDLPQNSQKHLAYITKLDSSSLSGKYSSVRVSDWKMLNSIQLGTSFMWIFLFTRLLGRQAA
jgi:hypothetical protein